MPTRQRRFFLVCLYGLAWAPVADLPSGVRYLGQQMPGSHLYGGFREASGIRPRRLWRLKYRVADGFRFFRQLPDQPGNLSRCGELSFAAFRALNPAHLVADLNWHGSRGHFVSERQPEVVLTQVLHNYGALWGGMIAPDRVNKLQPGEGAIYIMPSGVGDAEARPMADFVRNGGRVSVFFSTGGTKMQETSLSKLFGVKYAPVDKDVQGTMQLGPNLPEQPCLAAVYGEPQYVSTGQSLTTDFIEAKGALTGRVLLRGVEAGKGRAVFSSLNGNLNWGWDHDLARKLARYDLAIFHEPAILSLLLTRHVNRNQLIQRSQR